MSEICSICLDEINENKNKLVTECNHTFHTNCYDKYYTTTSVTKCPNCRSETIDNFNLNYDRNIKEQISFLYYRPDENKIGQLTVSSCPDKKMVMFINIYDEEDINVIFKTLHEINMMRTMCKIDIVLETINGISNKYNFISPIFGYYASVNLLPFNFNILNNKLLTIGYERSGPH
jgi:hypothetical protein